LAAAQAVRTPRDHSAPFFIIRCLCPDPRLGTWPPGACRQPRLIGPHVRAPQGRVCSGAVSRLWRKRSRLLGHVGSDSRLLTDVPGPPFPILGSGMRRAKAGTDPSPAASRRRCCVLAALTARIMFRSGPFSARMVCRGGVRVTAWTHPRRSLSMGATRGRGSTFRRGLPLWPRHRLLPPRSGPVWQRRVRVRNVRTHVPGGPSALPARRLRGDVVKCRECLHPGVP